MVSELAPAPSDRTLRRWDLAAAVYVLGSPAVDAAAGWQVWSLAELYRGLLEAADALTPTAPLVAVHLPLRVARAREVAGPRADTCGGSEPDRG